MARRAALQRFQILNAKSLSATPNASNPGVLKIFIFFPNFARKTSEKGGERKKL
jgi:hypothetical protein